MMVDLKPQDVQTMLVNEAQREACGYEDAISSNKARYPDDAIYMCGYILGEQDLINEMEEYSND